ncbi:DJ-1/PfpI family protein [Xanthomonas campestris pv. raphani]|nr:DJ-1/PfpI family protein [Xanthomonas campestris]MEA9740815.1 DJ-1/PfpI family protein [Xanthomonas campestris pv. raphani]
MFGNLEGKVRIVILGERAGMVASSAGPAVAVDHALDAAPHIDILMVPGGMGTRREMGNTALIASITRLARSAPHVASICTGAALLARTSLLDGRRATTNKRAFNWVTTQGAEGRVGEASTLGGGRPCVHLLWRLRGYGHGIRPDRKTVRPRCRQAGRRHRGVPLERGFHQRSVYCRDRRWVSEGVLGCVAGSGQ